MNNLEPWISKTIEAGQRYGRYVVISTHKKTGTYVYYAYCQCDCGAPPKYVQTGQLRNGQTASCGCLQRDRVTKHGVYLHPLYKVWRSMKSRCTNPKDKRWDRYGGRGITICERWNDVLNFIEDMNPSYSKGLQIDRKDNDKGYSPDNCRWATTGEQTKNYSRNVFLTFNGETHCLADWSTITGINYQVIWDRVQRGWSDKQIVTTKVMTAKQSSKIARDTRWSN